MPASTRMSHPIPMIQPIARGDQDPVREHGDHRRQRAVQNVQHVGVALILLLLAAIPVFGQAGLAGPLKHQFFTSAGAVCSGCKLYSYAAGTSTPLSTYTTSALSTPNANPTILDSAGRVPGSSGIFLTAASYKFELQTAADAAVWVQDNVADVKYLAALAVAYTTVTSAAVGTLNDFNPGIVGNTVIVMTNASTATITGFPVGVGGQQIRIVSSFASQVDFAHENTGSSTLGRLSNFVTSAPTSIAGGGGGHGGSALYQYDAIYTSRWRLVSHEQGNWITPTFAAGNFTANAGTWTVGAGDVITNAYRLSGKTLSWNPRFATTSVSNAGVILLTLLPGGFISAAQSFQLTRSSDNGAALTVGTANFNTATSQVQLTSTLPGVGYAIATNTTEIAGVFTVEVQ